MDTAAGKFTYGFFFRTSQLSWYLSQHLGVAKTQRRFEFLCQESSAALTPVYMSHKSGAFISL